MVVYSEFVWYIDFTIMIMIYTVLYFVVLYDIIWHCGIVVLYGGMQNYVVVLSEGFECSFQFSLKYEMKWSPLKYYDVWYEWCWSFVPVWSSHVADQQMNRRAWSTTKYSFSSKPLDCHKICQYLF